MHDLQWRVLLETSQPIFLGDNLAFRIAEGFVKLVVIGEFKFCEYLIYGIDTVELGRIVKFTSGFRYTFAKLWSRIIPPNFFIQPNFGRRFA